MSTIRTVDGLVCFSNNIVLIRRAKPPFQHLLVLPGGHVEETDENLALACIRELKEEVGLNVTEEQLRFLIQLKTPGRDPRYQHSVSDVFVVKLDHEPMLIAQSDAREVVIRNLYTITPEEVGFDHFLAIELLRNHQ